MADIYQFQQFLGPKLITQASSSDVRQFCNGLTNYATRTVARKKSALGSFYRWLQVNTVIPRSPVEGVSLPPQEPTDYRILTTKEIELLFAQMDDRKIFELRDRIIFLLLIYRGLKVSDLVPLTFGDLDIEKKILIIPSRDRRENLTDWEIDLFKKYRTKYWHHFSIIPQPGSILCTKEYRVICPKLPLFANKAGSFISARSIRRRLSDKYVKHAGLSTDITTMSFRHSFAMHQIMSGIQGESIRQMLGLCNMTSIDQYQKQSHHLDWRAYAGTVDVAGLRDLGVKPFKPFYAPWASPKFENVK